MTDLPSVLPHRDDPALQGILPSGAYHPGLLFQRWLPCWKDETGARLTGANAGQAQADKVVLANYAKRWKPNEPAITRALARQRRLGGAERVFRTTSRLSFGLGADHPFENGFSFEYISGMPVLPGSTLKGLARAYGRLAGVAQDHLDLLFGRGPAVDDGGGDEGGWVGAVVFLDAWPEAKGLALEVDILNPHEPGYYRDVQAGKADVVPLGTDSPIPVTFLAVKTGARYRVRVLSRAGSDGTLLDDALTLLEYALEDVGVGGKTAAGYGRMEPVERRTPEKATPPRTASGSPPPAGSEAAPVRPATPPPPVVATLRPHRFVWINATREPDRKSVRLQVSTLTRGVALPEKPLAPHPLYSMDDVTRGRVAWDKVATFVDGLADAIIPAEGWTGDGPLLLIAGLATMPVWGRLGSHLTRFAADSVRVLHSSGYGPPLILDPSLPEGVSWLAPPAGLPEAPSEDARPVVLSMGSGTPPVASQFAAVAAGGVSGIVHLASTGDLTAAHAGATFRTMVAAARDLRARFPAAESVLVAVNGPSAVALFAGMAITPSLWGSVELLTYAGGAYASGLASATGHAQAPR